MKPAPQLLPSVVIDHTVDQRPSIANPGERAMVNEGVEVIVGWFICLSLYFLVCALLKLLPQLRFIPTAP
ncbi:MAG: hypothetical protein QMB90_09605, partial [Rubritalea sp.]